MRTLILTLILTGGFAAFAAHDHDHKMPAMPKEFDTMKQLVGTWEGMSKMEGKDVPVTVVYELTSGGTVVTEKLGPGTEHEMISIYHRDGKTLGMTHYCAMGNQPHMVLKKADGKTLTFEMAKPQGVASMKEPHMHGLTLTLADNDTLKQEWMNFKDGKKDQTMTFTLKRKK